MRAYGGAVTSSFPRVRRALAAALVVLSSPVWLPTVLVLNRSLRRRVLAERSLMADRLGARDGRLVHERLSGNMLMPFTLRIVTIRPGTAVQVAGELIKAAESAGYQLLPFCAPPCDAQGGVCRFRQPSGMPSLAIATMAPGQTLSPAGGTVPPGSVGVIINL
jgi:hypothetical protein